MKLSVIVPVFNTPPDLIKQCINSIIWQSLERSLFELILVDDCSTNAETRNCLATLQDLGVARVVTHACNLGLALSRKTGVVHATGEFVTFVDSDDLLGNKALEVFYYTALRSKADLITSRMRRIGFNCRYWYDVGISHKFFDPKDREARLLQLFTDTYTFSMCGRLYKKAFLDLQMFDVVAQRLHEDLLVTTDCVYRAHLVEHINYSTYYYRETPGSITQIIADKHIKDLFLTFSDWYNLIDPLKNLAISNAIPQRVYSFLRMIVDRIYSQHKSSQTHTSLLCCLQSELLQIEGKINFDRMRSIHNSFAEALCDLAKISSNSIPNNILKPFARAVQVPQTAANDGAQAFPDFDDKIVFVCEVDYHFEQAYYLSKGLVDKGLNIVIIDNSAIASGAKRRVPIDSYRPLTNMSFYHNTLEKLDYKSLGSALLVVMFNDYNKTIEEALQYRTLLCKPSISFVEGINDFRRVDSKVYRERPYRKSRYVCLPGVNDLQYFTDRIATVVGMPKIEELYFESASIASPRQSGKFQVAINLNFTYGILEDQRDRFLASVLEICRKIKVAVRITKHPADKADVPQDILWKGSQNELIRQSDVFISRFATGILESLAIGTPVIYYNPHNEKVAKFKEPLGAFVIANNISQLETALVNLLSNRNNSNVKQAALPFLREHCNLQHRGSCAELFASLVFSILSPGEAPLRGVKSPLTKCTPNSTASSGPPAHNAAFLNPEFPPCFTPTGQNSWVFTKTKAGKQNLLIFKHSAKTQTANREILASFRVVCDAPVQIAVSLGMYDSKRPCEGTATKQKLTPGQPWTGAIKHRFKENHADLKLQFEILDCPTATCTFEIQENSVKDLTATQSSTPVVLALNSFAQANRLYREQNYAEALRIYEALAARESLSIYLENAKMTKAKLSLV
jgi:glycosyltransferase involved in cell wall biosynthesis